MPSLKYFLRDPATDTIREYSADEVQQVIAETKKPVFVSCLGMDGFSSKTEPSRQLSCVESFFDGHSPSDFTVITIVNGEKFTDTKLTNYMLRYNQRVTEGTTHNGYHDEFDAPQTFGMQLLKDIIEPHIPYIAFHDDTSRAQAILDTKIKLSQFNFFAHSFGTVVLAETFDYLHTMLEEKGFTQAEACEAMACMGKLNVGNSYHITEQHCTVPGIDFNSALDRIARKYNTAPTVRDSNVLITERLGNGLQLWPLIGSNSVPVAKIKAKPGIQLQGFEPGNITLPHDQYDVTVDEIGDNNQHALQIYMYKDRVQVDLANNRARILGQATPGAEIANRFMMDLFISSSEAVWSGVPRDTLSLVKKIEIELADPLVRDQLAKDLEVSQEKFFEKFGTPRPARDDVRASR